MQAPVTVGDVVIPLGSTSGRMTITALHDNSVRMSNGQRVVRERLRADGTPHTWLLGRFAPESPEPWRQ